MSVIGYRIFFKCFFLLFRQKYLQHLITNSVLQTSKMRSSWDNRISKNQQTDPAWANSSSFFLDVFPCFLSLSLSVLLYIFTFVWVAYVCFLICLTLYLYLCMSRLCLFLYLSNFMLVSLSFCESFLSLSFSFS